MCLRYCVVVVIARMTSQDAQCSVILTTHSMEEAEALCTRIGVSKCKLSVCCNSVFFCSCNAAHIFQLLQW